MRQRTVTLLGILFWILVLSTVVSQAQENGMSSTNYGDNVKVTQTKAKITIEIDASKEFGLSKSEKTIRVASTRGNAKLDHDVVLGLNCYKYADKK